MKDHNLYTNNWENPEKKHALDVSFNGISEYKREIVHLDKPKKVKRSDVPPMYRKSIGEIVLKAAVYIFFFLSTLNCILFFATVL
jgi:hypothetical protein